MLKKKTTPQEINAMSLWIFLLLIALLPREAGGVPDSLTVRQRKTEFSGITKKSSSSQSPTSPTPCNGVPSVPSHRRACNFFVWDAPSALFYKWCHHLVKDNIYEGKGGHMFVRYESNSILQLLYPCSRYSPNRCLVCGGSFPDHLELWWSKHMYTPFDRHLEGTHNNALILNEDEDRKGSKSRTRGSAKVPQVKTTVAPSYAFHRGYVLDVSQVLTPGELDETGVADYTRRMKKVKQKVAKEKTWSGGSRLRLLSQFPSVAYVVADLAGESRKRPSITMRSVRAQVMHAVDSLLELQERENERLKN